MGKFESTGRVVLDKKTTTTLKERYSELKSEGGHYQLSYSKLASWIVNRYLDAYYVKEQELIKKAHFNPKGYMRSLLTQCESQRELEVAMKGALKMMTKSRSIKKEHRSSDSDPKT